MEPGTARPSSDVEMVLVLGPVTRDLRERLPELVLVQTLSASLARFALLARPTGVNRLKRLPYDSVFPGRCAKFTRGSLKAQSFSRALIEPQRDLVELRLGVAGQIGSLGQVLSQQSIGVFVRSSLPGAVRITEVNFYIRRYREVFVFGHLQSAIPS